MARVKLGNAHSIVTYASQFHTDTTAMINCQTCEVSQSWHYISHSIARVKLGNALSIATCGYRSHRDMAAYDNCCQTCNALGH